MAESANTLDPIVAARIAALEAMVAEQRVALDAERTAHLATKAERDRLREAYDALVREVELARRRLVVAKAERVDTAQLELEFATKLAELDALSRKAEDEIGEKGATEPAGKGEAGQRKRKKHKSRGRRDLRTLDVPEERIEISDPLLEGKASRIGAAEESVGVRWRRGGFVRVVFERVKYDATTPAMTKTTSPTTSSDSALSATTLDGDQQPEPRTSTPACTPEELAAIVTSDPRTAGAVIVTAPMPPRLIERSYATPSLIAHIASDKFCDGLPLHRQEDRFTRLGVPIDRGTMCRWLEEAGGYVGATIVEAMRKEALGSAHCIATDATGIRVQPEPREDKQSQPCRRAHFFVQIADADHVFFEFTPEETSEVVDRMFAGYTGFVQADAKSVFDVLFRVVEDRARPLEGHASKRETACTEVGCWSHARTKFWETAVATQDVVAREALARIMRMFHLDAMWKNRLPDVRKDLRERYLRAHVTAFFEFVEQAFVEAQHRRGMLRSALGYCRNQKAALMRFLDDGALEMTNNRSERQLRRVATGRQAWLFVGSDLHGLTSGYLMTLIASARLHRLDPEVYLRDVFRVLPHWPRDRYLELAPRYWRITRARLRSDELEQEVGWLTIPEPPLPTMPAINQGADSSAAAMPVPAP